MASRLVVALTGITLQILNQTNSLVDRQSDDQFTIHEVGLGQSLFLLIIETLAKGLTQFAREPHVNSIEGEVVDGIADVVLTDSCDNGLLSISQHTRSVVVAFHHTLHHQCSHFVGLELRESGCHDSLLYALLVERIIHTHNVSQINGTRFLLATLCTIVRHCRTSLYVEIDTNLSTLVLDEIGLLVKLDFLNLCHNSYYLKVNTILSRSLEGHRSYSCSPTCL